MATRTRQSALTIRAATEGDLDDVATIERSAFNDPWSRRSFSALVGEGHVVFLVATNESGVVAYAIVLVSGVECELANLAVTRLIQRQGLGARLLAEAMERARERGGREMFLEVRASNAAAIQLYTSAGFQAVGRRVRYYARPIEDAIVMKAALQ
jgi:[ribosomal protein S18]-alanine N-acetyltransferase